MKPSLSSIAGFVLCGVTAAAGVTSWFMFGRLTIIAYALATLVLGVCGFAAAELNVDRTLDVRTRSMLKAASAIPVGGDAPAVGELWKVRDTMYCIAAVEDNDKALEIWLRTATKSCEDGTQFIAVVPGAKRRVFRNNTGSATIADVTDLRRVLHPTKTKKR